MHFFKGITPDTFCKPETERGVAREEKGVWLTGEVEIGVANRMEVVEECQSPFWPGIKTFQRAPRSKGPLKFHSRP